MNYELQTLNSEHPWTNKRVLVTGGAGFIGSHLVEALDQGGARVTVLDNMQAGKWENLGITEDGGQRTEDRGRTTDRRASDFRPPTSGLRCIEGDVRDADCVRAVLRETQPSVIFHLAANASVPGSVDDPVYDFESNAAGTFVVLDSVRRLAPDARVVAASSAAVYGEPKAFPITEDSPLEPISPYGASKLCGETVGRVFNGVYGVKVMLARIFNSYGPRMPRFVVLDFLNKLRANPDELEILGSGKQVRDFNYVGDTAKYLLALAANGVPGESYNLASGTSHSVTELAHILLRILGLEGKTVLQYTGSSWKGDAQRWEVSVGKAQGIGCKQRVALPDGLRRVVEWYLSVTGPCDAWPVCSAMRSE